MTIFKTAYETTATIGFKLDKTIVALKAAYYDGGVKRVADYNIYTLEGRSTISNDVPPFSHPLILEVNNEKLVVVDVRNFGKYDINQQTFIVKNDIDYSLLIARAKLNHIWINDNTSILRNVSIAPMTLFANWIAETIGKRFALDPKEQFNLCILSAIYYNSLFTDSTELEEQEKLKLVTTISRALRASTTDVLEIVDSVSVISSIFEFCGKAEEITGSIRLKDLNVGVLYTLLSSTWFGANSKEMVAVALEHPPTWLGILLSAFTERTFKNSLIAKLAERTSYKKLTENFVIATLNLIRVTSN